MCFRPGLSLLIGCRYSCHNVTANRQTIPILQLGQNQKAQVAEVSVFLSFYPLFRFVFQLLVRAEEAEDEVKKLKREVCDCWHYMIQTLTYVSSFTSSICPYFIHNLNSCALAFLSLINAFLQFIIPFHLRLHWRS